MPETMSSKPIKVFLQPLVDYALIQIAATQMSDGYVSSPVGNCYSVAHYLAVTGGPSGSVGLEVWVFCLNINGYLFSIKYVR